MPTSIFWLTTLLLAAPPTTQAAKEKEPWPFFAMDTATKDDRHQSVEAQVAMIKELGYAGWGPALTQNIPETLKALDVNKLKLFALYTGVNLDAGGAAYDPKLKEVIPALKGRKTIIWVYITSQSHKPSATEGDERAVPILREIADLAREAGLSVSIYPHVNNYVERTDDAVRLAKQVKRPNLGVTFNLCHYLKAEGPKDPEPVLRRALPYLNVVNINGADREGHDWDRLIQPLGRGDYDVLALLKTLKRLGYAGPIGFQGYGIKGDMQAVLKGTMEAWKGYQERLGGESGR